MSQSNFISFEYIARNEQRLMQSVNGIFDLSKLRVIGTQDIPIYDSGRNSFFLMTGFFIEFDNVTYGSISITDADITTLMAGCTTCGGNRKFKIHVPPFVDQFV